MMTRAEIRNLQFALNRFTKSYLSGISHLHIDGNLGVATQRRIRWVKFYLGYLGGAGAQNTTVNHELRVRMRHPKDPRYSTPVRIARAARRRRAQRAAWKQSHHAALQLHGVTTFDGIPVAAIAVPTLKWCRAHGWAGRLVSGWRSPEYSDSLCRRMCGAPRCPGKCAGRSSNHVGTTTDRFAIDVSDYATFARVVARCPLRPHIHNSLGAQDPVHFSPSGN